ncbi:uncharacterized protein LOC129972119 [Argiope bruennichi]|uniref:Uncharacterized protein n=1 Tax=Argiope bruennichi TaxID=94029 RepID=A0A8T0FEU1_ARGBR|nr:uncharacterized protein LOC129972119 [Argiope bruennichi]KAF8787800.1 hypothetical protein HNY73_009362 [Argiope bruennichi]
MISTNIPSLFNMCATSIVYRLWTHQDIYENWHEEDHWQQLEKKVEQDVKEFIEPLPELIQSLVLPLVKPAGRHYFSFLSIWFKKIGANEKWLKKGMLSSCLTLYPVGIINQRKTARKFLGSQSLHKVIAFRLACINFLEVEVLRLWPSVLQYFLNRIVFQYFKMESSDNVLYFPSDSYSGFISEPSEVFFWIGYCLSIEKRVQLHEVPHFSQYPNNIWYKNALCRASASGCIPFFEYESNCSSSGVFFSHEDEIKNLFIDSKNYLVSLFYHFSSMGAERKTNLFREFPRNVLSYFLQWPLSLLLLENTDKICYLLDQLDLLDFLFAKILEIFYFEEYKHLYLHPKAEISDVYVTTHLQQIWISFWRICPREVKLRIINSFAFRDVALNWFLERSSYQMNYDLSTFKKDLIHLFSSNGEAFLNFLTEKQLTKALEDVVTKFMTEKKLDFRLLQIPEFDYEPEFEWFEFINEYSRRCIHFIMERYLPSSTQPNCQIYVRSKMRLFDFSALRESNSATREFIDYIQEFLISNNLNDFNF